jgi:hypothetical protein
MGTHVSQEVGARASDSVSNRPRGKGYDQGGARRRDAAAGASPPGWGGGRRQAEALADAAVGASASPSG